VAPIKVVTEQAACYLRVVEQIFLQAGHRTERYATDETAALW
jgi:hypothetical protein